MEVKCDSDAAIVKEEWMDDGKTTDCDSDYVRCSVYS